MVNTRAMAREEHSSAWHQKSESWPHISSPGRMVGHGVSEVWGRLSVGKIPPLSWSFPRQLSPPCGTSSLGKPFTSSPCASSLYIILLTLCKQQLCFLFCPCPGEQEEHHHFAVVRRGHHPLLQQNQIPQRRE